ncbi:MAG: nucleoside phosphorylase [Firmicutes bacterium]|nr:nucleoside phosphorylase [Bacillota bacterium]
MKIKKEFPILEFDPEKDAHINPRNISLKYPKLPSRLVVCFFNDVILKLLEDHEIFLFMTIVGENNLEVYKFFNHDLAIIPGKLGAPACAGFLDECIALGSKYVMFCGGGGVLRSDLTVGKLIVIDSAIRDEGTSYHYVEPKREIQANQKVVHQITQYLKAKNIDYVLGKTWTTDAFYRETKSKIALRKEEGAILVEMEQSAMIAVSQFRGIEYGAIIYSGDDLSTDVWDSRGWKHREDIRYALTMLCVDIVLTFDMEVSL